MDSEWVKLIVSVLSGLTVTIPLVIQLVKYVQKAIKERNWTELVGLVAGYMERAEKMLGTGAERKEWVLAMVQASADTIKYEIDMDEISALIDRLCDMSKVVNSGEVKAR